jgi:hypothetical protein
MRTIGFIGSGHVGGTVAGLAERLAYFGAVTTTLVSCGSNPDELAWFATCHPAY